MALGDWATVTQKLDYKTYRSGGFETDRWLAENVLSSGIFKRTLHI